MTLRWMPACLAATAAVSSLVAAALSLTAGCTSNDTTAPATLPTQCPATLAEANGQACASGLLCPYEFACGAFQQQATCSCTGAVLTCAVDSTDAAIPINAAPSCSPATNAATCPTREPDDLSTCTATGLTCLYDGLVCPGSASANIDTCECQGGTSGGLVYNCVIAECIGAGGDAGVGTPSDARADQETPASDAGDSGSEALDSGDGGG